MIAAVIVGVLAACIAVALAWYVDGNRHGEERDLAQAHAAGFVEKQAQVEVPLTNGATGAAAGAAALTDAATATVNYAECPETM